MLSIGPFALRFFTPLALAVMVLAPALASPGAAAERAASGLALPRFVSVRGHEVNLRAGPGLQYPIEWVYQRQGLPLEVIAEYKTWRRVRDWEGAQGWVHQSMLAGKRTFLVAGVALMLRSEPAPEGRAVARLSEGVVGELSSCPQAHTWCEVDVDGFSGWLEKGTFWGLLKGEAFD